MAEKKKKDEPKKKAAPKEEKRVVAPPTPKEEKKAAALPIPTAPVAVAPKYLCSACGKGVNVFEIAAPGGKGYCSSACYAGAQK
jgi:hypothetical protein